MNSDKPLNINNNMDTEWLTISEAISYLKTSRTQIYRWAKDGKLTLYKFAHKMTRVKRSELEALAKAKSHKKGKILPPGSKAALLRAFNQMSPGKEGEKIWKAIKEMRENSIGEKISA